MNKTKEVIETVQIKGLDKLYESVPSGRCLGCTNCCSESVNVSFLEFANIIENAVSSFDEETLAALKKRLLAYYLKEWVTLQKCPFLSEDETCLIYEFRPLPCRIFGTSSKKAYESNFANIRAQNRAVSKSIKKQYDLEIPFKVVARKIEFCENFIPDRVLTTQKINDLYSQLINLDGKLYFDGLIDESAMNGDLVGWMIDWIIAEDAEKLVTKKMLFDLKLDLLKSKQKRKQKR